MSEHIEQQIEKLKNSGHLPIHIAIIMDGNGRWAKKRKLPRLEGHRVGRESVRAVVRTCAKLGVPYLTLYTFSLENWQRPSAEVRGLMAFLEDVLDREYLELNENGVQLRVLGRTELLPKRTLRALEKTMEKLKNNDRLILNLALSYGGRAEIVDASRRLAEAVSRGEVDPAAVDDEIFRRYLYDPSLPDPDLLIRTSGEMRISNFLLWQIAYSEIYVTDVLWPDFREQQLIDSISAFLQRERRFGL